MDTNVDRFIDRLVGSSGGSVAGNAMIGMAKGMGLYKKVEIAGEVREGDEPEPDPDDPIQVTIDPDHPENTRIVYRMPTRRRLARHEEPVADVVLREDRGGDPTSRPTRPTRGRHAGARSARSTTAGSSVRITDIPARCPGSR